MEKRTRDTHLPIQRAPTGGYLVLGKRVVYSMRSTGLCSATVMRATVVTAYV